MKKYYKRTFNSPLMKSVNFVDGSFVNLIKLNMPYADGKQYAIYETIKIMPPTLKLFKNKEDALKRFDKMVGYGEDISTIRNASELVNGVWITLEY